MAICSSSIMNKKDKRYAWFWEKNKDNFFNSFSIKFKVKDRTKTDMDTEVNCVVIILEKNNLANTDWMVDSDYSIDLTLE